MTSKNELEMKNVKYKNFLCNEKMIKVNRPLEKFCLNENF